MRVRLIFKCFLMAAGTFALVGIGLAGFRAAAALQAMGADAKDAGVILASVKATLLGTHKNGDDGMLRRANLLVANADAAMNAIKQTAQDTNAIAKAEVPRTKELADQSIALIREGQIDVAEMGKTIVTLNAAIAGVQEVVQATGVQLNDGTLPALKSTLTETTRALATLDGPDGLLMQSAEAAKSANLTIGDPHIKEILAHMDSILASSETSSQEIATGLGYVNGYLKPSAPTLRGMIIAHGLPAIIEFGIQALLRRFDPERVEIVH
jgi:hypothetical protein